MHSLKRKVYKIAIYISTLRAGCMTLLERAVLFKRKGKLQAAYN